ncbi:DUF4214 domain-containing protein [Massilia arenae]|uniref:DUF4214 domain-containing protein n=1 Tax=Massilia arenae TaxID=2603288 RepID=A0A5C7FL79_9BURK|nr:DUF4214 domain-containing protein [Massilia arenae]TXF96059.1 DUF4214 domain-containing protein [Massilia arenae]
MYDTNATAISNQLKSTSATFFTDDTIASILDLISTPNNATIVANNVQASNNATISDAAGVDIVFVETSATERTNVNVTADIPAIFFQGAGGVNASIGAAPAPSATGNSSAATVAGQDIERVVVGTAGADTITIVDGKNTQVIAGDKDTVVAGSGWTHVVAAQGKSTVVGNDKTIVEATGAEADFTIATADGKAVIVNTKTGVSVELTDVNYVQLNGTDALIFADNTKEAAVANLYHALLGRNADAAGLEYWFDVAETHESLHAIAGGFLGSAEYTSKDQTDAEFIDALYAGLFGRDDATGAEYWLERLEDGASRADVATSFAEASVSGVETDIVGTVTIIDPTA